MKVVGMSAVKDVRTYIILLQPSLSQLDTRTSICTICTA